jgi:ParB family chromosome partitioning protein
MDALQDHEGDDENDDREFLKLEAEAEPLEAQLKALQDALCVWPSELMAQAGCVVFVGSKGTAEVKYGLVRPDDRNGVADVARKASEVDGDGESVVSLPSAKTRPVHSEKLTRRLTAHRVAAVQAELTARPDVALAALTAQLAQSIFRDDARGYHRPETVFAITAADSQSDLQAAAEDMQASAAWARVQAERTSWAARLPQQMDQMFPWLLTQDQATVVQLLTFTVAMTVTGIYGTEPERQRTDALAAALGLDMSKWWTATSASYFSHVSKARILDVVTEAVDANAASPLAALKKADAASGAEQTVAATGWLPACLRTRREAGRPPRKHFRMRRSAPNPRPWLRSERPRRPTASSARHGHTGRCSARRSSGRHWELEIRRHRVTLVQARLASLPAAHAVSEGRHLNTHPRL